MSRDDAWLLDIANAARDILDFCHGANHEAFAADVKTQAAVMHRLMVIGEAAKRLSDSFRQSHAELPWTQIAGMRDRLIHGYDKVRLDVVWQVVQEDVPELLSFAECELPSADEGATEE